MAKCKGDCFLKEKKRIPFQNVSVEDGETLNILGEEVKIIEVLGHTSSHIAFFLNGKNPVLFIGDTLFWRLWKNF